MNRVIGAVLIGLALFGGWKFVEYASHYEENRKKQAAIKPVEPVRPEALAGLPAHLIPSLEAACHQGTAAALRQWLRTYGNSVQDPRKAWIELDYCRMLARDDPNEAKRVFALVKKRTPQSSPVWPRIMELSATFE